MSNLCWHCCIEGCRRKWTFPRGTIPFSRMRKAGWRHHDRAGWLCPKHSERKPSLYAAAPDAVGACEMGLDNTLTGPELLREVADQMALIDKQELADALYEKAAAEEQAITKAEGEQNE